MRGEDPRHDVALAIARLVLTSPDERAVIVPDAMLVVLVGGCPSDVTVDEIAAQSVGEDLDGAWVCSLLPTGDVLGVALCV